MSASVSDTYGLAHLPECPLFDPICNSPWNFDGTHLERKGGCMREGCQKICICDELRACEQRVMEDVDIILPKCTAKSYREGYAAALDAAEAAVTAMPYGGGGQTIYTPSGFTPHSVVAAIRALKETP